MTYAAEGRSGQDAPLVDQLSLRLTELVRTDKTCMDLIRRMVGVGKFQIVIHGAGGSPREVEMMVKRA